MSLKTFFVKYSNEARQIIHSDLQSIEEFCNMHFGSAWDTAKAHGAHIAMTEHDMEANLVDEKYHPMFLPAEDTGAAAAPSVPNTAPPPAPPPAPDTAAAPASPPAPAPDAATPAAAPTDAATAAPETAPDAPPAAPAPDAPSGDVTVSLTGAESTTALGSPQS